MKWAKPQVPLELGHNFYIIFCLQLLKKDIKFQAPNRGGEYVSNKLGKSKAKKAFLL